MPIDPITIREGDNAHIDFDLKDVDEFDVETPITIADTDRIRVILVDKDGLLRYTYDSQDPENAVTRIEVKPSLSEIVSVDITGSPTGGTFTLTFGAQETSNIAFDADAAAVQSALEALSSIGSGNVSVTGTNPTFTVLFTGDLAQTDVGAITKDETGLTGGSTPDIAISVDVEGLPVDNRVRIWPNKTTFRSAWSPYKIVVWRNVTAETKYSYPRTEDFTVNVLSAYGTGDI